MKTIEIQYTKHQEKEVKKTIEAPYYCKVIEDGEYCESIYYYKITPKIVSYIEFSKDRFETHSYVCLGREIRENYNNWENLFENGEQITKEEFQKAQVKAKEMNHNL